MRLLFLTPQLPYPPHKGTTIRNFHLLKNLARRHEVTLLSFHDPATTADLAALRPYCAAITLVPAPRRAARQRLLDLPFPGRPDLVHRLRSADFVRRLARHLEGQVFDLVQIEGLEMALHWELLVRRLAADHSVRPLRLPEAILDAHNAEYVLQRRAYEIDRRQPGKWWSAAYSLLQWQKLLRYERHFCRLVSGVVAASALDQQALRALDRRLRIAVVPNGVDTEHFRPAVATDTARRPGLLFTGTMDFRPNVDGALWFCQSIWPQILAAVPDARLWLVGRDPKAEVCRLADGHSVFVTGAVPDVRPYLAAADLTVVPLRMGGGTRLKVLEAMAAGVPVVATSLGCEGIAVTPATALVADNATAFAQAVVQLLRDEARRCAIATAARALVERAYDWRAIVPRLEAFYHEVLSA